MRIYEELFIIKPEVPEEEIDAFIEQMRGHITHAGGTVDKVEKWGKRRLAYKVEKNKEGSYVLLQFTAGAEAVKEVERRLRVAEQVIKFLTVRIDETLKRLEKRKKDRDKRAHRKASQPQAAAAASCTRPCLVNRNRRMPPPARRCQHLPRAPEPGMQEGK